MTGQACKCLSLLQSNIGVARTWDVLLLVPQIMLLIFFSKKKFFKDTNEQESNAASSETRGYIRHYKKLIWWTVLASTVRAILSIVIYAVTNQATGFLGFLAFLDKVLWVLMTATLMLCELLVLDFGLSCELYKMFTRFVGFVAIAQILTELCTKDWRYNNIKNDRDVIFKHGHTVLWFLLSSTFALIYILVSLLPYSDKVVDVLTKHPINITVPSKKSFYVYTNALAALYSILTLGTLILSIGALSAGFCLTNLASYIYYTFYALLLYRLLLLNVINHEAPANDLETGGFTDSNSGYRPLMDEAGSDDELLNLGDQF